MIVKNAKSCVDGILMDLSLLINNGVIDKIVQGTDDSKLKELSQKNEDGIEIDCHGKILLPGIIDIHAHLRDMEQSEKETFRTGTQAAACSGITTVFTMPNTKPPAINAMVVKKWMQSAEGNIFTNVGFIAGVPQAIDEEEFKKIVELGVFGFKIYPLSPLEGVDWTNSESFLKILSLSSRYDTTIFIHPDWPLSEQQKEQIRKKGLEQKIGLLKIHNMLYPEDQEIKYVKFVLDNYTRTISKQKSKPSNYPKVHFCHISSVGSYDLIRQTQIAQKDFRITFEVTPHHLLLSNSIALKHESFAKVLPPLRDDSHSKYLFEELKKGNISTIATDHAPHTLEEKSVEFFSTPSGFPGFETFPSLILNKVFRNELSIETFIKITSQNTAKMCNLFTKGFIKEGMDADLTIVEQISEYAIDPSKFKTKAKFSPYEGFLTNARIWKSFLKGREINSDAEKPRGEILKKNYKTSYSN